MKKRIPIISLSIIFISILVFQFITNYNFRKEPPSSKWSKEVLVGSGNSKEYPRLIKNKDHNIIAFDDHNNVKIVKTDSLGKKIKEKVIDTKNDFIKEINLVQGNTKLYLTWLSSKSGVSYIQILELDNEFNINNTKKIDNVVTSSQIDKDIMVLGYKDKIEVWDVINDKHMYIKSTEPAFIGGISKDNKKIVVYMDKQYKINTFDIYKDKLSATKLVVNTGKNNNMAYENMAFSADDKSGYVLIEQKVKNEYVGVKQIKFDLNDTSKYNMNTLYVNEDEHISCIIGITSKDGARFLGTMNRTFALKNEQENIVDFTIKDGKVIKSDYVSRLAQSTIKSYLDEDTAVFLSFKGQDMWNVYLTSETDEFKAVNNNSRAFEKKDSLLAMLQGLAYSLAYIFVYALKWIIPATLFIAIMSFFDFTLKEKSKKVLFVIISAMTVIVKTYAILNISYGEKYFAYLPDSISSKVLGVFLCLAVGTISYGIGYKKYKSDIEALPAFVFMPFMLIDTVLTMMIFIPFLP